MARSINGVLARVRDRVVPVVNIRPRAEAQHMTDELRHSTQRSLSGS